ncbi:hypothetical protein TcasGA2_TC008622 [Tribolium castaneum]|uniref:Uncharacterized protein n=1 Tax=Tribolium castaneum TaxID=7070 RepID=D6WTJ8_TRICA|nr:hypothetical protein TcasGA2_TC008622 [Tribolium castaneum]
MIATRLGGTAFAVQHDGMDRLVLEPLFIPSVQSNYEGALQSRHLQISSSLSRRPKHRLLSANIIKLKARGLLTSFGY